MGWFDNQMDQRKQLDTQRLKDAFSDMASTITSKKYLNSAAVDNEKQRSAAYIEILLYLGEKASASTTRIRKRSVVLTNGWYQNAMGPMLGKTLEGESVAFIPKSSQGYTCYIASQGRRIQVNSSNQELFAPAAEVFYRPFPKDVTSMKDFVSFLFHTISVRDFVTAVGLTILLAGIATLIPYAANVLFARIIPAKQSTGLVSLLVLLTGATLASVIFHMIYQLIVERSKRKMEITVEAATMMKLTTMPATFFRQYSPGDLAARVEHTKEMGNLFLTCMATMLTTGIGMLVSLLQLFAYGKILVLPTVSVLLITVVVTGLIALRYSSLLKRRTKAVSVQNGFLYALLSGIQKIKLTGSQNRLFAKWAEQYKEVIACNYAPGFLIKLRTIIAPGMVLLGYLVLYECASMVKLATADFYSGLTIYAHLGVLLGSLCDSLFMLAQLPAWKRSVEPILITNPEGTKEKYVVSRLSGNIELSHVDFRYHDKQSMILDDLSVKINRGEYIAIVGESGCGKSTLLRLLLGFEEPLRGAIYYDGRDLSYLEASSFRKRLGVVLQDSMLFQGDIRYNITLSKPDATDEEVWEVAELVGIAEDIRRMPMGIHTLIGDGTGGLSGGQRQRILIARAVLAKPRILLLDEATSALDNITQKQVSDALAKLRCTRIVIAHRLSTIRQCNRILYLEKGKLREDGTYEELMQRNGCFAGLVKRQQIHNKGDNDGSKEGL